MVLPAENCARPGRADILSRAAAAWTMKTHAAELPSWSGFTLTGNRNRSSIIALSHFRTENRMPPPPEFIIGPAFGRTRWRGAGILLKML
jgi:hypothetical protein